MATSIPFWLDDPKAWSSCQLGPDTLPGIVTVTPDKARDVDVKKTKGKDGASQTDNGTTPGKVTIELWLGTRAHWQAWLAIRPRIDPLRPGSTRTPIEIHHPATDEAGIRNVYVTKITASPPSAKAGRKIRIECNEWFPETKKTKANTGKSAKVKHVTYSHADPLAAARAANPYAFMPTGADAVEAAFKKF